MIPYGRQDISEADIEEVVAVLRSDWLTQGPAIDRFETALAAYCGAKHAVAVSNGTAALHLSCLAAGLKSGERLWTSPNTFVASANCGLYCGASVDFVDIDPATFNMSAVALQTKLEAAARDGQLPQIVIPVHFAGQPCDMAEIRRLSEQYGFRVIEDASHALGGDYRGEKIGACSHSEMAVLSFHPVKIITTGEGGAILTNSTELYEKLRRLRTHGIVREPHLMENQPDGPWYYEQIELGFNYRITDIQAALGTSQLRRADQFIARRRMLAERYQRGLAGLPLVSQMPLDGGVSAWHLYVVRLKAARVGHRELFEKLRAAGIGVNLHYIPVYRQPYYQRLGFSAGNFPEAEAYYREAISLPLYPGLSEAAQDSVINQLVNLLG